MSIAKVYTFTYTRSVTQYFFHIYTELPIMWKNKVVLFIANERKWMKNWRGDIETNVGKKSTHVYASLTIILYNRRSKANSDRRFVETNIFPDHWKK